MNECLRCQETTDRKHDLPGWFLGPAPLLTGEKKRSPEPQSVQVQLKREARGTKREKKRANKRKEEKRKLRKARKSNTSYYILLHTTYYGKITTRTMRGRAYQLKGGKEEATGGQGLRHPVRLSRWPAAHNKKAPCTICGSLQTRRVRNAPP